MWMLHQVWVIYSERVQAKKMFVWMQVLVINRRKVRVMKMFMWMLHQVLE
jgi:hypothetical protein